MAHMNAELSRDRILEALSELSKRLGLKGIRGEICIFGGSAMVLAFRARQSTKDIDAVFAPPSDVREIVQQLGKERHYADGWFNDGIKGFLSNRHDVTSAELPQFDYLQVTMPVPEYLFAMKCMSARVGLGESQDETDARLLAKRLNLENPDQAMTLVAAYYPTSKIPPRTQYFIEALFPLNQGNPS